MTRPGPRHVPAWLETATAVAWRVLVVAAAFFVFMVALSRLTVVVVPVIGALFVSAILVPPARWLRRHGWPPLLATWEAFLTAATIVVGIGAWLVPRVAVQWDPLRQSLSPPQPNGLRVSRPGSCCRAGMRYCRSSSRAMLKTSFQQCSHTLVTPGAVA